MTLETYPAKRQRVDQGERTDDPNKKEITKDIKQKGKAIKRKPAAMPPVNQMITPYTPQQFFDQPANITNGQLLAMNPKFSRAVT